MKALEWLARRTSNNVLCTVLLLLSWVMILAPAYIAWRVMQ